MSSDLKIALERFRRITNIIPFSVKWLFTLVYLDDIVIFSKTLQEYIAHTKIFSKIFKEAGVTLKLIKFAFFTNRIENLGHIIKRGRFKFANHTADAIGELKIPTTVTELRSFFGL